MVRSGNDIVSVKATLIAQGVLEAVGRWDGTDIIEGTSVDDALWSDPNR